MCNSLSSVGCRLPLLAMGGLQKAVGAPTGAPSHREAIPLVVDLARAWSSGSCVVSPQKNRFFGCAIAPSRTQRDQVARAVLSWSRRRAGCRITDIGSRADEFERNVSLVALGRGTTNPSLASVAAMGEVNTLETLVVQFRVPRWRGSGSERHGLLAAG